MKKRTCRILLSVGIPLSVFAFIISLFFEPIKGAELSCLSSPLFVIFRILSVMGIILIIMALINYNLKKKRKK